MKLWGNCFTFCVKLSVILSTKSWIQDLIQPTHQPKHVYQLASQLIYSSCIDWIKFYSFSNKVGRSFRYQLHGNIVIPDIINTVTDYWRSNKRCLFSKISNRAVFPSWMAACLEMEWSTTQILTLHRRRWARWWWCRGTAGK